MAVTVELICVRGNARKRHGEGEYDAEDRAPVSLSLKRWQATYAGLARISNKQIESRPAQAHVRARTVGGEQCAVAERDMDRAIERASRLIRQLLVLAQVDSAPAGEVAAVDVAQLVRQEI
jgi:hypothetical protein